MTNLGLGSRGLGRSGKTCLVWWSSITGQLRVCSDQLIEGQLPRQKMSGKNTILLLGPAWMQLLTCLHGPAEQACQDAGRDWGCPDVLRGTAPFAHVSYLSRAGLQECWRHASRTCHLGAVCRWNTTIVLTGRYPDAARLLAVPLPARRASLLKELKFRAMLRLGAMGPLPDLVQTLSQGGKATLHGCKWPLMVPHYGLGSAGQSCWHCRAPVLLLGRRRVTPVTAHRNRLLSLLKRLNTNIIFCS